MDWLLKYVGQMGRTFDTRYKEHIHDIRNNNSKSGYSNHILNTGHTYGTITDIIDIITTGRNGKYLKNTRKVSHIRNQKGKSTYIDTHNPIFKALHEVYTK
jgi:hypothetical protein